MHPCKRLYSLAVAVTTLSTSMIDTNMINELKKMAVIEKGIYNYPQKAYIICIVLCVVEF